MTNVFYIMLDMLKLLKLNSGFFENEDSPDGGLHSILKIIEYYYENYNSINIKSMVDKFYPRTNYKSLISIANENRLSCNLLSNPDINFLIEQNKPFIFKCKDSENNYNFLLCLSYSEQEGFLIWDYRYGRYYATIKGLINMWEGDQCLFFNESKIKYLET